MARGFTLIELLVTLAIMATLGMVAVPMLQVTVQREKERELRNALLTLREGLDAYKRAADAGRIKLGAGDSGYPRRLEDLVEGVTDQKSTRQQKLYFLRQIPRDPFAADDSARAADTWAKRSYASPPDAPAEGDDVFDVRSRSSRIGLNGVRLDHW